MKNVIAWWSGGVSSAIACKLSIKLFGLANVRIVFIDTLNEGIDIYDFKKECEIWYGKTIETITGINDKWNSIQNIWLHYNSLNTANGAICSSILKRDVRLDWEKNNKFDSQVFGFDVDEVKRAKSMKLNYPNTYPLFPLLLYAYNKKDCISILQKNNIKIPNSYINGFLNNNCASTGCVQGGIGYWQKIQKEYPNIFLKMAQLEHTLTKRKGKPVTILKDQSKNGGLVFLQHNPNYPKIKNINMMKGVPPKALVDCNGYCALNDLFS